MSEDPKRHSPRKSVVIAPIKPTKAQEMALFAIYLQIVRLWTDAAPQIAVAYAADQNAAPEGQQPNPQSVAHEIAKVTQRAAMLMVTLPPIFASWASRVDKVQQAKWMRAYLTATKVDISTVLPPDMNAILKASVEWNTSLIKDVSDEIRRKIANIVYSGFQKGSSVYDVAKEINKATGMARRRARNIAYDQLNKLAGAANKARQLAAGVTHFQWIHSAKLHARPTHLARNGKIFPWENSGIAPDDMPSIPPFCGCTARAVIPAKETVAA